MEKLEDIKTQEEFEKLEHQFLEFEKLEQRFRKLAEQKESLEQEKQSLEKQNKSLNKKFSIVQGLFGFMLVVALAVAFFWPDSSPLEINSLPFKVLENLAQKGNSAAQAHLAYSLIFGHNTRESEKQGCLWADFAAKGNSAGYAAQIWCRYRKGTIDASEAANIWKRTDSALAWYGLGHFYEHRMKEKNKEAVSYYRKAARKALSVAQYALGECSLAGHGTEQDDYAAIYYFTLAAEQGYSRAQYKLGDLFLRGEWFKKNPAESVKWFSRAAKLEYPNAASLLKEAKKRTRSKKTK